MLCCNLFLCAQGAVVCLTYHFVGFWIAVRVLALVRGDTILPSMKLLLPLVLVSVRTAARDDFRTSLTMLRIAQATLISFLAFGRSLNGVMKAALCLGGFIAMLVIELKTLRFVIRRSVGLPAKY
jgi:hypothetical protein